MGAGAGRFGKGKKNTLKKISVTKACKVRALQPGKGTEREQRASMDTCTRAFCSGPLRGRAGGEGGGSSIRLSHPTRSANFQPLPNRTNEKRPFAQGRSPPLDGRVPRSKLGELHIEQTRGRSGRGRGRRVSRGGGNRAARERRGSTKYASAPPPHTSKDETKRTHTQRASVDYTFNSEQLTGSSSCNSGAGAGGRRADAKAPARRIDRGAAIARARAPRFFIGLERNPRKKSAWGDRRRGDISDPTEGWEVGEGRG